MIANRGGIEHNKNMNHSLRSNSLSDFSSLTQTCDVAALAARRETRWRPGCAGTLHSEVFASAEEGAGAGLALALARDAMHAADTSTMSDGAIDDRRIMWVQDRRATRLSGKPYRHGLPSHWRDRLIYVEAQTCEDALFALEEGLRCRDLAFVLGEIAGNPRALTFTASRRLSLASERYGVPLWLVRLDAHPDLSSARMRWSIKSHSSPPAEWDHLAPGVPSWRAELFRSRSHAPGMWDLHEDGGRLCLSRERQSKPRPNKQMVGQGFVSKAFIGKNLMASGGMRKRSRTQFMKAAS